MAKGNKAPNFTLDQLGFSNIATDPALQQAAKQKQAENSGSLFPVTDTEGIGTFAGNAPIGDYKSALDNGAYLSGSAENVEHQLGEAQSTGEQIGQGIVRFGTGVPIKLAEMVGNISTGIGKVLGIDALSSKNGYDSYLEDITKEITDATPFHATAAYDDGSIGKKLLTSKFWTEDMFGEGGSFLAAQIAGTKGLGALFGIGADGVAAISKATNATELFNAIPITSRIAAATANNFSTSTIGFINAAAISAMQAKGTANQIEAKLRSNYAGTINPDTGDYYSPKEIDQKISLDRSTIEEKTNNTFWATMATELLPSIYASKMFLGPAKTALSDMNADIVKSVNAGKITLDQLGSEVGDDVLQKAGLGKSAWEIGKEKAIHAAVIGGPVAMNSQMAIQKYDVDQGVAGHRGGLWSSSLGYARQFLDNFTQDEGVKGIVLGSLLGALTAGIGAKQEAEGYNTAMKGHLDSMRASDALFGAPVDGPNKTDASGKLILDDTGNPIPDPAKLTKMAFQWLHDKNNFNNQTAAIIAGSTDMVTMNEHVAMAQLAARELQSGRFDSPDSAREFFKWFHKTRLTEQSKVAIKQAVDDQQVQTAKDQAPDPASGDAAAIKTATAMKTGSAQGDATLSKQVNDTGAMIDRIFDLWKTTDRQAAKLNKFGDTPSRTRFNDSVRRTLYYEAVKREALLELAREKETAMTEPGADQETLNSETNVLQQLRQDSENRSSDFLKNHKDIYKEWNKFNGTREDLINEAADTERALSSNKDIAEREALSGKANTANYMLREHTAKEGVAGSGLLGAIPGPDGRVQVPGEDGLGTSNFSVNQTNVVREATPIGMRQDVQYKMGSEYAKVGRLRDMIEQVKSGDLSVKEVIGYANDNISYLDSDTKKQLTDLLSSERTKLTQDEEKLSTLPELDEEDNFNPEFAQLNDSIKERKEALDQSDAILRKKSSDTDLAMMERTPEQMDEHLNKKFAERSFIKSDNILANAIEDGKVKETYTDSRAVQEAIEQVTSMRDAIVDRTTNGDLKGSKAYNYLIEKANATLEKLREVQNAVEDNKLKRDGMQRAINQREASSNSMALGFNLDTNSIADPTIFSIADSILEGKLQDMLTGIRELPSGNHYEASMAIMHAIKTNATVEQMKALRDAMSEQADGLVTDLPELGSNKKLLKGFADSPSLYFEDMFRSMYKNGNHHDESKGGPLAQWRRTNDIDALESRVASMTEVELGVPIEDMLSLVRTYKQLAGLNRVQNLLNSKLDLSKTVPAEIARANDSDGIVPTAQQEIALRDGLAWLSSNKQVGTEKFSGWGFLRGIAGTGKTNVTVKWMLGLSRIKPEEIMTTAATRAAADVIGKSVGAASTVTEDLLQRKIPKGTKLIVIDEYARIPRAQLLELEAKIRAHNESLSPAERVRTLILGDPTQITPLTFANRDITNPVANENAKNIQVINPLTVVYRSEVSAVNETSDLFQDNPDEVKSINVRADRPVGSPLAIGTHTSKSGQDIIDILKQNQDYEQQNGMTPRTRVIITDQPAKYASTGVKVLDVYNAQSETFDEAYVDLNRNSFNSTEKYNTAMYTAASRARQYSYVRYDEGQNTTDAGLAREKENNDKTGREAKGEYIKAREEEQKLQGQAVTGKPFDTEAPTAQTTEVPPLTKATEPDVTPDTEIVTEVPSASSDEPLPADADLEGTVDPETESHIPIVPLESHNLLDGEHMLPNIEKGTFQALSVFDKVTGDRKAPDVLPGDDVHFMYTKEKNGQNAITAFTIDKDGNWIPVSKIFQDEFKHYPTFKEAIDKGLKPMFTSDPLQLNGSASRNPYSLASMEQHKLDGGKVTRTQRMTYVFGQENAVPKTTLAQHIKDIFKGKFFSSKASEQQKAETLHYKIFKNNEISASKFGDFQPEVGIPYAIIGIEPGATNFKGAQFIRLTANKLSQDSDHYRTLKAYRDTAKRIENETGVSPGTTEFNKSVRAFKAGLEIVKDSTNEGDVPKQRVKESFSRKEYMSELERITDPKEEVVDPLAHLSDEQFDAIAPHLQGLANSYYGLQLVDSRMTPSEMVRAHGEDYEHVPDPQGKEKEVVNAKGETVSEPIGRVRLKGTGGNTGKAEVKVRHYEITAGRGEAQEALNQLAKANEFVGNTRFRVDESAKVKGKKPLRAPRPTGKSLIADTGNGTGIYKSIRELGNILGQVRISEGKLTETDLQDKDTRLGLEKEVRAMAAQPENADKSIKELGQDMLTDAGIDNEDSFKMLENLQKISEQKDTPPISMATLDLLVGDENYVNGEHTTAAPYTIKGRSGQTKEVQTYLRTPLDIDQFNALGKAPEANAEALSKMVGTKFQDLLPTQIAVSREGKVRTPEVSVEPAVEEQQSSVPGSKAHLQVRIDELDARIAETKSPLEKAKLRKEQRTIIDERDASTKMFDENIRRGDKGELIPVSEAKEAIRKMLPNISDNEMQFLQQSLMIEMQRPGESLLGLFQKGKMYFAEQDGNVFSNVVRHEVFHKVFNDYLSNRDRTAIIREFDPTGKMNPKELEEELADRFMTWQSRPETVSGKIKRIFNRILSWIGIARGSGQVEQLFNDINNGKFQKPNGSYPDVRMAFSDIAQYGTVTDYKKAAKYVQGLIKDLHVDDHIENMPVTQGELFEHIAKALDEKYAETSTRIDEMIDEGKSLVEAYHAETDPEVRAEYEEYINATNDQIAEDNNLYRTLNALVDRNNLKEMWSDLYPNFKFQKEGIISFEEDEQHLDPEATEVDEETGQAKDNSNIAADHIQQSDEKNQEGKVSQNVKNFLSFIFRPDKFTRESGWVSGERINPRGVYLQCLRNLSNLQSSDADFTEQLVKRAAENGINVAGNSDGAQIIRQILNLYHNATGDVYTFEGNKKNGKADAIPVSLSSDRRFLDDNTFVISTDGKDISGITSPNSTDIVIRRNGRPTAQFLNELVGAGLSMEEAKGYFRKHQAQETIRELMSNFLSQRESTPMIAEEERSFGTVLKYFRAQNHGIERIKTTELENSFKENFSKVTTDQWKAFNSAKPAEVSHAIADLLKAMGVKGSDSVRGMNSGTVSSVFGDIKAFKTLVDGYKPNTQDTEASDTDEQQVAINPVAAVLETNTNNMLDGLTRLLTLNSSEARASSYTDVNGIKRYLFHNGSQAHDVLGKIVRFFNQKIGKLPDHLTKDAVLSKNIFVNGVGVHDKFEVLDHDGQRQQDKEEFATGYSAESNAQWLKRNFSDAFLTFAKTNSRDNAEALTYMQNFYTISNRPRMIGMRVKILGEPEIKEALSKAIEQHVEQPDLSSIKNYDRFKAVNFDEFHRALEEHLDGRKVKDLMEKTEGRVELAQLYDRVRTDEKFKSELVDHIREQLKVHAEEAMQRMKAENVTLGSNVHEAMKLLKDPRRAVIAEDAATVEAAINQRVNGWPEDDQMRPTVDSFYANNYVNSYFMNQLVAGNMNYFKDGLDMVKRMSGVFAPGTKGMVGDRFFMASKFKVAISSDPKMKADMLSPIFADTKLKAELSSKGFDLADAQGFMLPERAANIVQGFGQAYNAGAVFKPAHYEITQRVIDGVETSIPIMLKYSSVVLHDELVDRFPKLKALRDEMRDKGAHEFIFDSGTKVGAPTEQVSMPGVANYDNNNITIHPESVVELSGENYRLQLNPSHEAFAKTSNPTQLGYFMNVLHKVTEGGIRNMQNADDLYGAVSEKISRGLSRLAERATDKKGRFTTDSIKKMLTGAGNERLQEMLASGLSYNLPNIVDKAVIQMANMVSRDTVKIEFPGGKMVLQSSYGIDMPEHIAKAEEKFWSEYGKSQIADKNRTEKRLQYMVDPETKRWHAEVLLPMAYKEKANPGDFVLPDGMGFRIPSTELHSSLPLKVMGYYDDKGSNVIVGPAELVAQHGSDFDVDSLYVISREQAAQNVQGRDGIQLSTKGQPVGYYPDKGGKLIFNKVRFRNELEEAKADAAGDKKAMSQLEKLHDQFLNNQITESFLDTISHESNRQRMLTPISTDVITKSLKELGINTENSVNLSRLLDNLQVFNSNFQGASLVGIFANGMKALSYMSRAGVRTEGEGDAYPQIKDGLGVNWNDRTYDKFGEIDHTGGNMWEELDALVNTSVDNVKEQKLYHMNTTDRTGPAYVAAKAIGMPLTEAMRMMLQPIVKTFATVEGGRSMVLVATKAKLVEAAVRTKLIGEGETYPDLKKKLAESVPPTEKQLNDAIKRGTLGETPEEVTYQFHALDQFERINKMADDLTTFSRAIKILQDMPVFYKDIANQSELWNKIGTITNGSLKTHDDFSFTMDNLMEVQPNIKAAYEAFQWLKDSVDKSVIKHFPETTTLADQLASSMKIRLVADEAGNREAIKNEIVSYLVSAHYAPELATQEPVTIKGKKANNPVILTGRAAWSQDFATRVEKAIKANTKEGEVPNEFLKRIGVQESKYGVKTIQFANASNPDAMEAVEMQEGFSAITDPQLRSDFVKYAVLNFGLSFGTKNYSMFIPSTELKPVSDFISKDMKRMVQSSSVDQEGKLISGPLKNIEENLSIRMAVNNIKKLPFISTKKISAEQSVDEKGKPAYTPDGVPIMSGYNGDYYWHRAYKNPAEGEGFLYKEADLPAYMWRNEGGDRPAAYKRLNEVENGTVYYQRIGYQNYGGGYDATLKAIHEGYNSEDYFGKGVIPVPVADVRTKEYQSRNEHIKEGVAVVVYPYSNDTRELGIKGIVDKVRKPLGGGDGPFTFAVRTPELPTIESEQHRMIDVGRSVADKFNLGFRTDASLPAKGQYKDGIVTLNPKIMTEDTAFHEVSHPLVAAIKQQNAKWYQSLVSELKESGDGKAILARVKAKYPELDANGQEVEALVTAIGQEAAKRLQEGNFRTLVRRLMRSVGEMVKGIINEIKVKGGISLDTLKSEDMVKLTIGDIGDILAAKQIKLGLDLSEVDTQAQFSKDLSDDEPAKGSVLETILSKQDLIEDPTRDENGQEGDTYKFGGQALERVSKVMDKFMFREKKTPLGPDGKPMSSIDAIADREATRMFKNVMPGGKLVIDGIEQTKEEYREAKKKIQLVARVKGDIIHAKIQRQIAFIKGDLTKINELDNKIAELSTQVDKLPTAYDWIVRKDIFPRLMENARVVLGATDPRMNDTIASEVKIASPELGAGKVDMLVQKADGRLRIVDFKTGSRLKDKYSAAVLKYGVQEGRITDNPLDRAKLQLMTYALIIKAEHPEAQFDGLVVMHLPNELEAAHGRNAIQVYIPDYLRMMEQYYRHEEPENYKKLLAKSPNIFDPREYNAPKNADFVQDVINSNGSAAETLQKAKLDLQKLVVSVELEKLHGVDGWTLERQKLRKDLLMKIAEANNYTHADLEGALSQDDIGSVVRWLGNIDDNHNPLVQTYSTDFSIKRQVANAEIYADRLEFHKLLKPVIEENIGKRSGLAKVFTWADKKSAFAKLIDVQETIGDDGTKYVTRQLTTEKSPKWDTLSPAEKALATHMNDKMEKIFNEVMVNGPEANVTVDKDGNWMNKLDLYNKSPQGASFKYSRGFMPRVAITAEEVAQRAKAVGGLEGLAIYKKDLFLRNLTDYFENNIEGQNQKDYGLPVRYLGNGNTYASPESYSSDIQMIYEKFMDQMISKKHLDSAWVYGQAVKGILDVHRDANGNPLFEKSVKMLENDIINKMGTRVLKTSDATRHGLTVARVGGKDYKLNINKAYRSSKSGVAAATLWLQLPRSAKNAMQATYMIGKEAAINHIATKYAGVRIEEKDLTLDGHYKAYGEAIGSQMALAAGKGNENFVHTLAKTLQLYPDLELGRGNESMTKGLTLLDTKNMGFLYQVPEEVTTMQHTIQFLRAMKITTGNQAGKTMYDVYKEAFRPDPAGGSFELPKDFKRGVIAKGDGTFEDLAGLHPLEVRKLKRTIKDLKGGYSSEERTELQASILGDAFMMFKRWIPAMAIKQYRSKFTDTSIGQFELSQIGDELQQRNGEPVYEWRARVVEGRWRTLANVFMNAVHLNSKAGYAWSDLSGEQRKALVDLAISSGAWISMLAVSQGILGKRDENDSIRKFTSDMGSRYFEQWNGLSLLGAAAQPPAVVKTSQEMIKGFIDMTWAEGKHAVTGKESDLRTNKGDIKGTNLLLKHIPLASSYYESKKFHDDTDDGIWSSISGF